MSFGAFNANLARASVGNDNAPTIWTYRSTDATSAATLNSVITASGYFNAAANRLKVGDLIFVTSANSTSGWAAGLVVVKSNTRSVVAPFVAGVVDCFDATVVNVTLNSY